MPEHYVEKFWSCVVAICVTLFIGMIVYVFGSIILADGSTKYCYIESQYSETSIYKLRGARSWREDRTIAKMSDPAALIEMAATINCPIK